MTVSELQAALLGLVADDIRNADLEVIMLETWTATTVRIVLEGQDGAASRQVVALS